jgi:hypothetical protein
VYFDNIITESTGIALKVSLVKPVDYLSRFIINMKALYAFQGHELMQGKGIERRGKSRDTGRNGNTDSEFDR